MLRLIAVLTPTSSLDMRLANQSKNLLLDAACSDLLTKAAPERAGLAPQTSTDSIDLNASKSFHHL